MIEKIAHEMKEAGINSYYVGGAVRDKLMGIPIDDIDICLVNVVDSQVVTKILEKYCDSIVSDAGSRFPVWIGIIGDMKIDYALARRENLVGKTRQDFQVDIASVSIEEDLKRRDLTINAIAENVLTGEIVDPFNGRFHIENKVAHYVSSAFMEDTLRVLRTARFIARFELVPTSSLITMCKNLKPTDISNERVGMELMKMFKTVKKPSLFFNFLREVDWLGYYFKELENCIDVPQDFRHHPEGCVYTHTLYCIDESQDWFIRAVMLCHDLGKAECTTIDGLDYRLTDKEGKIQSIGHEERSDLGKQMLKRIHFASHNIINQIGCLIELHMVRTSNNKYHKVVRKTLRRLMHYGIEYSKLAEVCKCDVCGRPPKERYIPDIGQDIAEELLKNGEMIPIVTGEDMLALGIQGPDIGNILDLCLSLQDRGTLRKDNWKGVLKGCNIPCLKNRL
jgi:tRNA nucleotidyltransferase (CCA-adding enzyme)